ncbi:pumilio homolog 5-like [Hibiscus syriacus]|uniref:pumilio homolog 5-like n=1 Tax=Hibiscus syriacus TaxID=106335 RepID=UPI0019214CD0|nr:pumilio homolog 5-like [Hibiscus syriacus]
MATESPMRIIESSGVTKWCSSKDALVFGSPLKDMEVEELRMLLKGQRIHGDQTDKVPNRSGSAPPSMEGSFTALGNLLAQQNANLDSSLASLSSVIDECESEVQLRSHPAYLAYYCSNINLNPRLPPPLISHENRRLACHIGGFGNNWRATSMDDSGNGSLPFFRTPLTTHKEEVEDDRSSPRQALDKWAVDSNEPLLEQDLASFAGRHKSLVDLIQEDFPRTPSPVYSLSRSSGITTADEPIDHDVNAISSNFSSINSSKVQELILSSVDVCVDESALDAHATSLIFHKDSSEASIQSSSCTEQTGRLSTSLKEDTNMKDTRLGADASGDVPQSVVLSTVESRMRKKQEAQQSHGRNVPREYYSSIQPAPAQQAQELAGQAISQGLSHLYSHPKFSSVGSQPLLHSSGLTPPMYATTAPYMTSGFANFQPSGLYAPQYNISGYHMNPAFLPPFMGGYPSHAAVSLPFDSTASGSSFSNRTYDASTGESTPNTSDLQHLGHFYGHHGLVLPPSLVDPLHMQYLQHSFSSIYGPSIQHGHLASTGVTGGQVDPFVQKESSGAAYIGDLNLEPPINGRLGIPNPGKVGSIGGGYYGGHQSMGVIAHYPTSPLASPLMPSSPVGGMTPLGRRNETRFPPKAGPYSGWQGQRVNIFEDSKQHSFLEELKSSNARKFDLSDISGRIVEFSVDQHGSRFIQQKLENCCVEDKESVYKEVLPHASRLMTDVFGNYVIQKFFEHGSSEQRNELADQLVGNMLNFSLQMYGCRVIQKALEVIELDQKIRLVEELDGHVMKCVRDQNGNHVIQKCIECIPMDRIGFIISAFRGQVATLSTHPYGCRVIQRILEHSSNELQSQCIIDEILDAAYDLSQDQYGNYVTQHVLERGKQHERGHIISKFTGKTVQMSQHKYASNVVEKCLEYGDSAERECLVEEIIGQSDENDSLLTMMKDQFANYVVQKVLEVSNDRQRELLLDRIRVHLNALKKYTYGKHIAARFEQVLGEESDASASGN